MLSSVDRGAANMLRGGTSYHLPLGMCLNERVPNLAVVGRCASSTHEAHSSVRVQTHCMVMGQGAGTASDKHAAIGLLIVHQLFSYLVPRKAPQTGA